MTNPGRQTSYSASIQEEPLAPKIRLILREDADAFRWYEFLTDNDTEVSGHSSTEAITNAQTAWRNWNFSLRRD